MENFERRGKSGYHGGGKNAFKGGFKGNRGGFGGRNDREDRGPVTMHSAICSSCKKPCEVPFRPTGDKPVYCRDCFAGRAGMGGDRSDRKDFRKESRDTRDFAPKSSFSNDTANTEIKKQLEAVNNKLERLITLIQSSIKTTEPVSEPVAKAEVKAKKVSKKK